MKIDHGKFKVIAIGGDTHLGGADFDNRLVDYFVEHFKTKLGKDMSHNKKALYKLRVNCELAKRALSEAMETTIEIDSFLDGEDFLFTLSRALFEKINADLFTKSIQILKQTVEDSKFSKSDIDDVVLVGGSIRIPKIQSLIKEFFDGKEIFQTINPDEAVAYGAAIQAAILTDKTNPDFAGLQIVDVTPLSLGIEIHGGIMSDLIKRNTRIPCKATHQYTTCEDYQRCASIMVYEGERSLIKDNLQLGQFVLENIEYGLAGVAKIEVTVSIDSNGILTVFAKDKKYQTGNSITISNPNGHLSQEQIFQMISTAAKFKMEDKIQLEKAIAKNKLETACNKFMSNASNNLTRDNYYVDRVKSALDWVQSDPKITKEEILKQLSRLEFLKI